MQATEQKQALADGLHRVKVYKLSGEGQWDDTGTGFVCLEYLEASARGRGLLHALVIAGLVIAGLTSVATASSPRSKRPAWA